MVEKVGELKIPMTENECNEMQDEVYKRYWNLKEELCDKKFHTPLYEEYKAKVVSLRYEIEERHEEIERLTKELRETAEWKQLVAEEDIEFEKLVKNEQAEEAAVKALFDKRKSLVKGKLRGSNIRSLEKLAESGDLFKLS